MNVAKIAGELCGAEMERAVELEERARGMISFLMTERVRRGVTQSEIAKKMGVSVSKVSRMEDSRDADIKLGEISEYASALGLTMSSMFDDSKIDAAARVKMFVLRIASDLEHLTDLAKKSRGDRDLCKGIAEFRGEVLLNFLTRYAKSGAEFPRFTIMEDGRTITTSVARNAEAPCNR